MGQIFNAKAQRAKAQRKCRSSLKDGCHRWPGKIRHYREVVERDDTPMMPCPNIHKLAFRSVRHDLYGHFI
jgi:hypothetical protein